MRQFSDIDIMAHEDDIVSMCNSMESYGYIDGLTHLLRQNNLTISDFNKDVYFMSGNEKQFFKESSMLVEIKKSVWNYNAAEVSYAIKRRTSLKINGYNFYSLSLQDIFTVLIENTFTNFYADYGIQNDYIAREIVDFHFFLCKYGKAFSFDFMETFIQGPHGNRLAHVMSLVKNFFCEKALSKIPQQLLNLSPKTEPDAYTDLKWQSCLYQRIFNPKKRMEEFEYLCYLDAINSTWGTPYAAFNINKHPYNLSEGKLDLSCMPWVDQNFTRIQPIPVYWGIGYDEDKLYLSLKVHTVYPNMRIEHAILNTDVKYGEKLECKVFVDFVDKQMTNLVSDIENTQMHHAVLGDYDILTISFPRHGSIKHKKGDRSEYFAYFEIHYLEKSRAFRICLWGNYREMPRCFVNEV